MTNKLENDLLKEINDINEGFASIIGRLFFGSKAKKMFKQVAKVIDDDPEVKAAFIDLKNAQDRLADLSKGACDRNPYHPYCIKIAKRKGRRRR